MLKKLLSYTLSCLMVASTFGQTTYVPLWAKESWLLDRMEIKAGTNNDLNLSTVKPYMRKAYVAVADSFRLQLQRGINTAGSLLSMNTTSIGSRPTAANSVCSTRYLCHNGKAKRISLVSCGLPKAI